MSSSIEIDSPLTYKSWPSDGWKFCKIISFKLFTFPLAAKIFWNPNFLAWFSVASPTQKQWIFLSKFFKSSNQKELERLNKLAIKIKELEEQTLKLEDKDFPLKTNEFIEKIKNGTSLENILPEAFALAREASRRVTKERHFDVQIIGGIVLHENKIAEMKTGEGKTLLLH